MPKSLPAALLLSLQAKASRIATCIKIERKDEQVFGFTEHSKDLLIEGLNYVARTGFGQSAIANNVTLDVDNLDLVAPARELIGMVVGSGIVEADIRSGLYDSAAVTFFEVDHSNVALGKNILRVGIIGEINLQDGMYKMELRGMTQKLTSNLLRVVRPDCDADLFDTRCGVSETGFTNTGTIATIVLDRAIFTVTLDAPSRAVGYFNDGIITFTSGFANGKTYEIADHAASDQFSLFLRAPFLLQVGDTFLAKTGCDKTLATCRDKFDAVVNFRGFPKVPGQDQIFKIPDVK